MLIELSVRRLFCDHDACDRRTFAEQVEGLTVRYGRRTPLLRSILEQVAVALAGRAGARLAGSLQATVSRSTMLRLVMALPDPPPATPRVLGVDDFALRRGHVYGTLLVDCETTAPLDLLAGREAQPLVAWLRAHPGVEVICRDRSGAYAEGARCGAPDAVQVADRFHLWQNLGKAVEGCVARHRACLRAPGPGPDAEPLEPQEQTRPRQVPVLASEEAAPTGRFAERARRHHALVHDLLAQGHGLRAIARRMGWGRHTVQSYARAASWQELVDGRWQQQRPSKLDPFKPTSSSAGSRAAPMPPNCTGRSPPWACRQLRAGARLCGAAPRQADPAAPTPPTVRQVTGWLTRHPKTLTEDEQPLLKRSWSGAQSCGQPPVTSAPSASCSRGSVARSCPGGSPPCAPTAYPACRGLPPDWSTTSTRWPAA